MIKGKSINVRQLESTESSYNGLAVLPGPFFHRPDICTIRLTHLHQGQRVRELFAYVQLLHHGFFDFILHLN